MDAPLDGEEQLDLRQCSSVTDESQKKKNLFGIFTSVGPERITQLTQWCVWVQLGKSPAVLHP